MKIQIQPPFTTGLILCAAFLAIPRNAQGQLFVADNGTYAIGEYTTSGATVNSALFYGNAPTGIAVYGGDIYVENNSINGTVGEYTTSGAIVNATLISGLANPFGIAVSGGNIFVVNYVGGTIGEYTLSGATVMRSATRCEPPIITRNICPNVER